MENILVANIKKKMKQASTASFNDAPEPLPIQKSYSSK
jgi:hypothetical protein